MLAMIILVGVAYLALNFSENHLSDSSSPKSKSSQYSYKKAERQLTERTEYLLD